MKKPHLILSNMVNLAMILSDGTIIRVDSKMPYQLEYRVFTLTKLYPKSFLQLLQ